MNKSTHIEPVQQADDDCEQRKAQIRDVQLTEPCGLDTFWRRRHCIDLAVPVELSPDFNAGRVRERLINSRLHEERWP